MTGDDSLIIGKFCAIATHVKFIMNGARIYLFTKFILTHLINVPVA
ncbi:MAG: hypothetical protein ACKPB7_27245 [Sphaerospermopsis kisseleviana]